MNVSKSAPTPFGRALRNVGWLLTGKGVGAVLSLVYLALATRSLGIVRFGEFTLILSTGQAVAALVGFQTWQVVVRYGMAPLKAGDTAMLGRLVRWCMALDLGAALFGCLVASVAIAVLRVRLGWNAAFTTEALLFCFVLLLTFRSTAVGILRLHDRFAVGAMADAVTPFARCAGAIAAVLMHATVQGFLLAWAGAELLTAIVYWTAAHRAAPGLLGWWRGAGAAPRENAGLWHFAVVTNLNATLNAASKQVVVVLVGFATGPAAAGAYRLAYQLSQALTRVSDMFSRGVLPEFTRAGAQGDRRDMTTLFRQSTRLALVAGGSICLLVPLLGEPALRLIAGKTYLGAYPVLVLLGLAAGLEVMGVAFEPVLLAIGRAATALRIRVASVVVLFAAMAVLMPAYGATGAAGATLVGSAVALILFGRVGYRLARAG